MAQLGQKDWEKSVTEKGSSMRKAGTMLPEWKFKGGGGRGLGNVFSVS